jgi:hypothetical protein
VRRRIELLGWTGPLPAWSGREAWAALGRRAGPEAGAAAGLPPLPGAVVVRPAGGVAALVGPLGRAAAIAGRQAAAAGRRSSLAVLVTAPPRRFVASWAAAGAVRAGLGGFALAVLDSLFVLLRELELWQAGQAATDGSPSAPRRGSAGR